MARNPPPEPPRLAEGWQALAVGTGVLAVVELCRKPLTFGTFTFGSLGAFRSSLAVVVGLLVVVALHHGLGWALLVALRQRFGMRAAFFGSLGIAVLYGVLWQGTVTGGDGLATNEWGGFVRPFLALAVPFALVALTALVLWPGRVPELVRTLTLAALLVASFTVTLFVLPEYRAFHGFLGGFEALLVALLVARRRATRPVALAVAGLCILAAPLLASRASAALGTARRYTRLPGTMLEALPLSRAVMPRVKLFVDPRLPSAPRGQPAPSTSPLVARGDSVLLVVLEATRADAWAEPAVAPEFSRWRSHGLYVPRAVSQYPATPLAYGAIFTSHPPSIVAQSPHWAKHRLFDLLAPRFHGIYLSQPSDRWFDTGAMTSFITKNPAAVRRHENTPVALTELRRFLQDGAGQASFFAWVHLFDPHRPWEARGTVSPKAPPAERYRSEVHAVDAELGAFMRWFYEQPFADRTLVLVVGDHGEAMGEVIEGEPYFGHHVHVADGIAHVPFYASGPGVPVGAVDRELGVCQLDVMPTLFDHLGVELPARFLAQGLPLSRLLAERPLRSLPTEAFSIRGRDFFDFVQRAGRIEAAEQQRFFRDAWETGAYPPKLALERGGWKLVRDAVLEEDALYDLRTDPRETRGVGGTRPAELEAMRRALQTWTSTQVSLLHELERFE